jgi:hypothetical protein
MVFSQGSGRMPRSRLMVVLALVAVVACQQQFTSRERALELRMVEQRFDAWVAAQNNDWRDSLEALYYQGPEVQVLWDDGGRTDGWEATQQMMTDRRAAVQYVNIVVSQYHSEVLSRSAALTVFQHSTDVVQTNLQRRPVEAGQGLLVWVKDPADEIWKIHTQAVSVSVPSRN